MNEVAATVGPELTPIPVRPTMHALATLAGAKWSVSYGGCPKSFILNQATLHPGSSLITIPGAAEESAAAAAGRELLEAATLIARDGSVAGTLVTVSLGQWEALKRAVEATAALSRA